MPELPQYAGGPTVSDVTLAVLRRAAIDDPSAVPMLLRAVERTGDPVALWAARAEFDRVGCGGAGVSDATIRPMP